MINHPVEETLRKTVSIASTAYDTAWVASVPDPAKPGQPRFPSALRWIQDNQRGDGSWGSSVSYLHDRIICTLAALIPLARYVEGDIAKRQLLRGERYLWKHAHMLEEQPCELVGFELLLPAVVDMALAAGVDLPPYMRAFEKERAEKLTLLPADLIYSPGLTIAHSLEFLGKDVDLQRLVNACGPNGSVGNSPAATAFLLHHFDSPQAISYIERCMADDDGRAVPVLAPCETFDGLWSAQHHWLGGAPAASLLREPLRSALLDGLLGKGVTLSSSFTVADADETAVALVLFREAGIELDPAALVAFERADHFVSFQYERHASVGVNAHVLMALTRYSQYPERERAIEKVLRFLGHSRRHGCFWTDKWHISPHYATGRVIVALSELDATHYPAAMHLLKPAVQWLMATQNSDGSWGHFDSGTVEETAYAVLALRHLGGINPRLAEAQAAGQAYLEQHLTDPRPAMWIDKCLYYPPRIVDAAVQAARHIACERPMHRRVALNGLSSNVRSVHHV